MGAEARSPGCGPAEQLDPGHPELCSGRRAKPKLPRAHRPLDSNHTAFPTLAALGLGEAQVGRLYSLQGKWGEPTDLPFLATQMF